MQQIEPENSEEIELEHLYEPKFIETFGNFGPSGFCCKEENRHLSNLNVCSNYFFPVDTAMEEITPLLTEKRDFENRDDSKLKTFSAVWTSIFYYKNQIKNFSIDSFSTNIELSIDTLMGETKPIDLI